MHQNKSFLLPISRHPDSPIILLRSLLSSWNYQVYLFWHSCFSFGKDVPIVFQIVWMSPNSGMPSEIYARICGNPSMQNNKSVNTPNVKRSVKMSVRLDLIETITLPLMLGNWRAGRFWSITVHSNGTLPLLLTLDVPLDARCGYSLKLF